LLRLLREREEAVETRHNPATGRPLADGDEAVETLTDPELEAELTVASFDPVRRASRYERLVGEWLRRGHLRRRRTPQPT